MNYFIGIDPSFNATAIMVVGPAGEIIERSILKTNTKNTDIERIDYITSTALGKVNRMEKKGRCIVGLESPALSSRGQRLAQMAGLNYCLQLCFLRGIKTDLIMVTPSELKKFICGKGNVKKNLMLLHSYKKYGIEFNNDDECDAYCIARFIMEKSKIK